MSETSDTFAWARLILSRRPQSSALWSLCEIRLTESEFQLLKNWLKNLSLREFEALCANTIGASISRGSAAIGLVLFLLEAETARREASEGAIWPFVRNLPWSEAIAALLFTSQGTATLLHRSLLQEAAQTFNLRHVFGREGIHNWIDSLYLQFGFTKRGALNRLGNWLNSSQRPLSVQFLLEGELASAEFKLLWDTLDSVSYGRSYSSAAARLLGTSPWILPEWTQGLLENAKRVDRSASVTTEEACSDPVLVRSVSLVRITEGLSQGYRFKVELANLNILDLEQPGYQLLWNDEVVGFVGIQQGVYRFDEALFVKSGSPVGEIALRVPGQLEPAFRQIVELWDPNDIVTLFSPSGERCEDSIQNQFRRGFTVIYHSCLRVRGAVDSSVSFSEYWKCFSTSSEPDNVELVSAEGEVLWDAMWVTAPASDIACVGLNAAWRDGLAQFEEGNTAEIRLHLPSGAHFERAYLNGRRVQLVASNPENRLLFVSSILTSSEFFSLSKLRVCLLVAGVRYFVSLTLPRLWSKSVYIRTRTGDVAKRSYERPIRTRDGRENQFALPVVWEDTTSYLMEGCRIVGKVAGDKPCRIEGLRGYGAPLRMVRSAFNSHGFQDQVIIAPKVRSSDGLIRSVKETQDGLSIWLNARRDPGTQDSILLLDTAGRFHSVPAMNATVGEDQKSWTLSLPQGAYAPIACVALLHGTTVLGSFQHATEFGRLLETLQSPGQIRALAACIRAFHLPFLERCVQTVYRKWVRRNLSAVLDVWLKPFQIDLDGTLIGCGDPEESWLEAVQEFFTTFVVPVDFQTASTLIAMIGAIELEALSDAHRAYAALTNTVKLLMEISPWLAGYVAGAYLDSIDLPPSVTNLMREGLVHECDCSNDQWTGTARGLQLDEEFWEGLSKRAAQNGRNSTYLEPADDWNVAVALKNQAFRRRVTTLVIRKSSSHKH
ncbi:MAG: hypothetical protein WCO60_16740 [Verrucomicrobiota bacterium]